MEVTSPSQNCLAHLLPVPAAARPGGQGSCSLSLFLVLYCCLKLSALMCSLFCVMLLASGAGEHSTGFILDYK